MRPYRKSLHGKSLHWPKLLAAAFLAVPAMSHAASCTTQSALTAKDRNALTAAGGRLAQAVAEQDYAALHSALLPAVTADWDQIRTVVELDAPLLKGGHVQLRNLYLLDAASTTDAADTQFFCSNADASQTVTLTMRSLPPGRYAVLLADAAGAPLGGQMSLILGWSGNGSDAGWKLGGVSIRPGILDGHDGVWYWTRAREMVNTAQPASDPNTNSNSNLWSAWYLYQEARELLIPVDYLSSPNLEKLNQEQARIKFALPEASPQNAFPYSIPDGNRSWKIDAVRLDPTLLHADLGVTYESTGVTDPAATRTEAVAVLSAFLKTQPSLRQNFHGLWAYAVKNGRATPVIELPMAQIP